MRRMVLSVAAAVCGSGLVVACGGGGGGSSAGGAASPAGDAPEVTPTAPTIRSGDTAEADAALGPVADAAADAARC